MPGPASSPAAPAGSNENSDPYINLLFEGDSISNGYGSTPGNGLDQKVVAALGDHVRWRNTAANGRRVSSSLREYAVMVGRWYDPAATHNIIAYHAGDNDVFQEAPAVETYASFTAYVALAHEQGWKVVVSTELKRFRFNPAQFAALEDYNALLRENTAGADAVVDFDLDPRMVNPDDRNNPDLFTWDGIHPSDGGYAVLAGMLAPAIKRLAGR